MQGNATSKRVANGSPAGVRSQVPSAAEVASRGLNDTRDLTRLGGSLINDMLAGTLDGKVANPVCRTANMMLRTVEIEARLNGGNVLPMA